MTTNRDGARRELIHARASSLIIRCFFDRYNELGYGYLEPIYRRGLEILLKECGLQVDRGFPIPVMFRGAQIGFHRCDLLVGRSIIVELKATELLPSHCERQVRNYLKGLKKDLGFVLQFGPKPTFIPVVIVAARETIPPIPEIPKIRNLQYLARRASLA